MKKPRNHTQLRGGANSPERTMKQTSSIQQTLKGVLKGDNANTGGIKKGSTEMQIAVKSNQKL